ncbi:MAG: thioredoxin family protein [Kiritimatiellia bacterium]
MKDVLMMIMTGCPHCHHAKEIMDELCMQHPEFRSVKIKIVDETREPEFAAKLDYYYVPTFFVNGEKIHEGVPSEDAIMQVYRKALDE